MNNNKGFTLIELLAVIVILAIIMVIAVPQILNIIDSSRESAWDDNIKLIKNSLEIEYSMNNFEAAISSKNCTSNVFSDKLKLASNIDTDSVKISDISYSDSSCNFKLTPIGQFNNQNNKPVIFNCKNGKCTYE